MGEVYLCTRPQQYTFAASIACISDGAQCDEIGYIPEENDLQTVEFCGFRFEIQKIQDKRIEQILVTEIPEPAGDRSEDSR